MSDATLSTESEDTAYREMLGWLFQTQRFGIKLGLENVRRLFAALAVPAPNERIIHVAGTNGKGSTCALIDSVCRAASYRTGLFTSPHLVTFRERVQVNGEMISEEQVARGLRKIREFIAGWDPHPTFFEITTALALHHFRQEEVEIVVLETGMGGRLDATNAVTPVVSVITPIEYDHQKWLGDTLAEIAAEKAGIIKSGIPVVSAIQPPEAEAIIRDRAMECDAPLDFVRQPFQRFPIALPGAHQQQNAALALSALHTAKIPVQETAIEHGLAAVSWPARFQRWDARTVIDGAHNPAGARILAQTWGQVCAHRSATILLAVLRDKDVPGICTALHPIAQRILLPRIQSERALPPEELFQAVRAHLPGVPAAITDSFASAWNEAQTDAAPILITGSLHFAGEALAFLEGVPAALEGCLQ